MRREPSHVFGDEGLVDIDGWQHYVIPGVDRMAPFLMQIVSDGDRWMFVSSTGALTAGRVDVGRSLFPYETDDRLHAARDATGPVTRLRATTGGAVVDWRPFAASTCVSSSRSLAKATLGDSVAFEEHHQDLGLTFGYRWNTAEAHGFIRTATLTNDGPERVRVDVLDGLVGVLPHGLDPTLYQRLSNLSHAYKRSQMIDDAARLAVYSLESPVGDRPEPAEVLRSNVVWSCGLDGAAITLDAAAVAAFEAGVDQRAVSLVTGRPGAYILTGPLELGPGEHATWRIVADVALDQVDVTALRERLRSGDDLAESLDLAVDATSVAIEGIMALADAQQCTGDPIASAHHVANVTYNVMRGGVPLSGYRIDRADFAAFVAERNRVVAERHSGWLRSLPASLERSRLLAATTATGDVHLVRLGREYLPFSFSRRHGDPSRPWNSFSVRVHDDEGTPAIRYEGNWRDLFQNWEALCSSFPEYLPGVVTAFVNASTADGHNPYRMTREGIDWEIPDPDDPWANIGYWGDHQLVYLLRLLDATDRFLPGAIAAMLGERCCTYADVPYRIGTYDALVRNPKSTITFDDEAHHLSQQRVAALGGDGKLHHRQDGELVVVTLLEKLVVTVLAKLANFVPGGGVWMNTQRPEWNDANNALVGYGLSMVTLYHLRQFLGHLRTLAPAVSDTDLSVEVATWLGRVIDALRDTPVQVTDDEVDRHRKEVLDRLGRAASDYRIGIYERGFSGATAPIGGDAIIELSELATAHIDATIQLSRRRDGLVHSYNLITFSADGTSASVRHLPEMLEGQVAALGRGVMTPAEQADLLDVLFASSLYRSDQKSFTLAPTTQLPGFLDKNIIAVDDVDEGGLLAALLAAGERSIVQQDVEGRYRFHPDLTDEAALIHALDRLGATGEWSDIVGRDRSAVLAVYEAVFRHRAFIGRSAAMYAYEGIGSIYWHMVGKLLVATQEAAAAAAADDEIPVDVVVRLVDAYARVRSGLGFNKTAGEFGAFPTDPYSHTPMHAGAQQPGMTGAVKEELLTRPHELGVSFRAGEVVFDPLLFQRSEQLRDDRQWNVVNDRGEHVLLDLEPGSLGLTVCQVPVVVTLTAGEPHIDVEFSDGRTMRRQGPRLGPEVSAMLFGRTGDVRCLRAAIAERS